MMRLFYRILCWWQLRQALRLRVGQRTTVEQMRELVEGK